MGFQTELDVRLTADGLWQHLDDLIWEGSDGDVVIVPKGRTTDFASVPRLLQWLLPSADARVVRAAAVHDELCRLRNEWYAIQQAPYAPIGTLTNNERWLLERVAEATPEPPFSSLDADRIFRKIMADEGAGLWMQHVGYAGVRVGAWFNPARR